MEERTYTPEDQGKPGSFRQSLLEWVPMQKPPTATRPR